MSSLEELDDLERDNRKEDKKDESGDGDKDKDGQKKDGAGGDKAAQNDDAEMKDAAKEEEEDLIDAEILNSSTRDIQARRKLLENDTRIMRSEFNRLTHEKATMHEKIKDNHDKIENNR